MLNSVENREDEDICQRNKRHVAWPCSPAQEQSHLYFTSFNDVFILLCLTIIFNLPLLLTFNRWNKFNRGLPCPHLFCYNDDTGPYIINPWLTGHSYYRELAYLSHSGLSLNQTYFLIHIFVIDFFLTYKVTSTGVKTSQSKASECLLL